MNCYDFELNISAYIEGELKQVVRENFNQHRDICKNCKEKLEDISILMENLPNLVQVTTSNHFDNNLREKIHKIDLASEEAEKLIIKAARESNDADEKLREREFQYHNTCYRNYTYNFVYERNQGKAYVWVFCSGDKYTQST